MKNPAFESKHRNRLKSSEFLFMLEQERLQHEINRVRVMRQVEQRVRNSLNLRAKAQKELAK